MQIAEYEWSYHFDPVLETSGVLSLRNRYSSAEYLVGTWILTDATLALYIDTEQAGRHMKKIPAVSPAEARQELGRPVSQIVMGCG